jgi:hypothetical protein
MTAIMAATHSSSLIIAETGPGGEHFMQSSSQLDRKKGWTKERVKFEAHWRQQGNIEQSLAATQYQHYDRTCHVV